MSNHVHPSSAEWAEIHNLYAYYNLCSDMGDAEGFASCFTDDGILNQVTRGLVLQGRRTIVEYKQKEVLARGGKYRRHWNSGLLLRKQTDSGIHGWCYLHAYNGDPGWLPVLQGAGVYDDTIVLADGKWKFAIRKLTMDARVEPSVQPTMSNNE